MAFISLSGNGRCTNDLLPVGFRHGSRDRYNLPGWFCMDRTQILRGRYRYVRILGSKRGFHHVVLYHTVLIKATICRWH